MQINLGSALAGAAQLFLTPSTAQFGCGSIVLQSRCSPIRTMEMESLIIFFCLSVISCQELHLQQGFARSFVTSLRTMCRNMQRAKSAIAVAACTSAAPGTVEMAAVDMFTGPLSGSVCSPPHTANFTRRALAPAHCIAPSKTRRCAG